jgi:hypothetical protein
LWSDSNSNPSCCGMELMLQVMSCASGPVRVWVRVRVNIRGRARHRKICSDSDRDRVRAWLDSYTDSNNNPSCCSTELSLKVMSWASGPVKVREKAIITIRIRVRVTEKRTIRIWVKSRVGGRVRVRVIYQYLRIHLRNHRHTLTRIIIIVPPLLLRDRTNRECYTMSIWT